MLLVVYIFSGVNLNNSINIIHLFYSNRSWSKIVLAIEFVIYESWTWNCKAIIILIVISTIIITLLLALLWFKVFTKFFLFFRMICDIYLILAKFKIFKIAIFFKKNKGSAKIQLSSQIWYLASLSLLFFSIFLLILLNIYYL